MHRTDVTQDDDTARLLKDAETAIVRLRQDNAASNDYIEELTTRLETEAREIGRLGEKIDQLEKLLTDVSAERDDVRIMLQSLRGDMEKIRNAALESLKNAKDKASLLSMAVTFYDVKSLADARLKLLDK